MGHEVWKGVSEKETSLRSTIEATGLQTDMDPSTHMPLPTSTPQHISGTTCNAFGPIFRFLRFWRANNPATATSVSRLLSRPFGHSPSVVTPMKVCGSSAGVLVTCWRRVITVGNMQGTKNGFSGHMHASKLLHCSYAVQMPIWFGLETSEECLVTWVALKGSITF